MTKAEQETLSRWKRIAEDYPYDHPERIKILKQCEEFEKKRSVA